MLKIITYDFFKYFISECKNKHVIMLAASSTFFFLLCSVPFFILISIILSYFFTDGQNAEKIFQYFTVIIPDDIIPSFKILLKHVNTLIKTQKHDFTVHKIFLVISSLGFFGSIWKAIEIITEEKSSNSIIKAIKSLGAIVVSFLLFSMLILGPFFLKSIQILLKKGIFTEFIQLQKYNLSNLQIAGVNLFSTVMLFLFFFLFFKYVLSHRAKFISLLLSSVLFTGIILGTKYLFLSYIIIVKNNLIGNFGSFYSVLIFVMWIFFSLLAFYISIIFAISHTKKIEETPDYYFDI